MEERGIWVLRLVSECWERTGKGPVSVRWVDTNKGSSEFVEVRSMFVGLYPVTRPTRMRSVKEEVDSFLIRVSSVWLLAVVSAMLL